MDTESAESLEKYIWQKRIWISKPDRTFPDDLLGKMFTISGHKTDMDRCLYFTYYYLKFEKHDNSRYIKEVLEHSAELSPVLKELFDI